MQHACSLPSGGVQHACCTPSGRVQHACCTRAGSRQHACCDLCRWRAARDQHACSTRAGAVLPACCRCADRLLGTGWFSGGLFRSETRRKSSSPATGSTTSMLRHCRRFSQDPGDGKLRRPRSVAPGGPDFDAWAWQRDAFAGPAQWRAREREFDFPRCAFRRRSAGEWRVHHPGRAWAPADQAAVGARRVDRARAPGAGARGCPRRARGRSSRGERPVSPAPANQGLASAARFW